MDALHQLEITLILFIQSLGTWLKTPLQTVSVLGNEEFFLLAMPAFYWCFDGVMGLRMAVMLLLSNGINCVFKLAFHAPRPYWISTQVIPMSVETSFGIPSAHAQTAAGLWGLLGIHTQNRWARLAALLLIFLIGFSRIYLGMHFISDVLTGWLLGGLLLFGFIKIEPAVLRWLKPLSFAQKTFWALTSSLVMIASVLLTRAALGAWQVPQDWILTVKAVLPDNPIDPLNLDAIFTVAGTWFGMLAGAAWLYQRSGIFNGQGTVQQRVLRYLIGAVGVVILYAGLGAIFPRHQDVISFLLRYLRYTIIGLWVAALAPLLFERLGLVNAPVPPRPAAPLAQ